MYTCHELSQVNNIQNFMHRHRVYTDASSHIGVRSYMWTLCRPTCVDTHIKTYIYVAMHAYMWLIHRTLYMNTRVHIDTYT